MEWRGQTLTVDSPIRQTAPPHQHHWTARSKQGDRIYGAWEHIKHGESVDGNLTPGKGRKMWFMHYPEMGRCGFDFIADKHGKIVVGSGRHRVRVRHATAAEKRKSIMSLTYAQARRYVDKHGNRPMTLAMGLRYAVTHGFLIAMEPKGPEWARNGWWFKELHRLCAKYGHPAWVKRLVSLNFARQTVHMAHLGHVQVAAIYGTAVKGRAKRVAKTKATGINFDATW